MKSAWRLALLAAFCLSANASMVYLGTATANGGGIGASSVLLTVQNNPDEQGCVGWAWSAKANGYIDTVGSAMCPAGLTPSITGGNEKTGASQTKTIEVSGSGVTSPYSMIILLNVNEPAGNPFNVDNLSVTIFSSTGAILYNSGNLAAQVVIANSFQGQGNPGFAFELDSAGKAAMTPYWVAGNRIGLAVRMSSMAGSNETLSLHDRTALSIATPEPASIIFSLAGLAAIAYRRRKA